MGNLPLDSPKETRVTTRNCHAPGGMNLKCYPTSGRTMPFYRTYVFDERGHMLIAIAVKCADDEEAIARAKQLGNGEVELWRRVPLFEPDNPQREPEP